MHTLTRVSALALVAALVGCGSDRVPGPPPVSPPSATGQALAAYDANKDGALDAKELEHSPGLKALTAALGKGPGGRLTADELTQQLQSLRDGGAGLTRAACQVRLDGRPLAGATVRYVPEAFLGPGFKPATGTTDAAGFATLVTEGGPEGVTPGLYRVEVSKTDDHGRETVPARYNAQTTLGCQVGVQARGAGSDVVFQLKK
jgi:hypothetical protein